MTSDLLPRLALAFGLAIASASADAVTCSASTAGLAFGPYDVASPAPLLSNVTVRITCARQPSDPNSAQVVGSIVSLSSGLSANFVQRQMGSGPSRLHYNVYTTNAYASVWGDGTSGTSPHFTSMMLNNGHPVHSNDLTGYGRVTAMQDVAAGSYGDALVVSVDF